MVKKANWEFSFDKGQHQLVEGGNQEPPDHKTNICGIDFFFELFGLTKERKTLKAVP